jgi:acyl-CoA synthetase (NDP forming)
MGIAEEGERRFILHTAHFTGHRAVPRIPIERVVHPHSIAVFGASESLEKFGGRIIHFLTRHGFAGEIYPINHARAAVAGRKAYARISDVPQPPDVAIVAVPPDRLLDTVAGAAERGVGCCVIISTGFAEAGTEGAERQARLVELSARTGMRVVGPNCMGLIVPHHRMALCSSIVLDTDSLGDGSIGFVSQSGALMVSVFDREKTDGIGLRYGISVGNQSDLEICDFLEFMIEEPETMAICLYVEGLLDGMRFRRAAAACRAAGKPLLLVKTGRTAAGVASAKSHTASLAGSWEAFAAICREEGVVLAQDPDEMIRAAHFLVRHPGRRGGGVGVLTSAGGAAATASDRVTELGLTLAPLTDDTRDVLERMLLPPQVTNPVDLGAKKATAEGEIADIAARALFSDPTVDYGIVYLMSTPGYTKRSVLLAESARECSKPVLMVCTPGAAADAARAELRKRGIVHFDSFEQALRVLSLIVQHDRGRALAIDRSTRPPHLPALGALAHLNPGPQTESEVKRLLAYYGVAVAREAEADSPEAAARAAQAIGFPVVLKTVSRDIVHKSDVGAVRIGLADPSAVLAAACEMRSRLREELPQARIDGYSVQEHVRGEAEVIVGARRDPQFGPVVIVGLGGIAVEILNDIAVAGAPVPSAHARRMIESLRAAALFSGARGRPPLDVDAIADTVERVSWLAHDLGARLVDLEVNPLIVRRGGGGAVAVDARAQFREIR